MYQISIIHNKKFSNSVVSFDLEWTKNYRIKNGNQPFCFSYVFFSPEIDITHIEEELIFSIISAYIEKKNEKEQLISLANDLLTRFYYKSNIIIGHQLSSDINIIINSSNKARSNNFSKLKEYWHKRKTIYDNNVFDTRYDLNLFLKNKSRRLVDVCIECNLDVSQPELINSMTKMQNEFIEKYNFETLEKLMVLNIRHSLSAAILYCLFQKNEKPTNIININKIIFNNLNHKIEYLNSSEFQKLL